MNLILIIAAVGCLACPSFAASKMADDRLMKELKKVYRSDSYKEGVFTVEVDENDLYNWYVNLTILDQTSDLYKGLERLKKRAGWGHIRLHIRFNDNYPFEPPMVRVAAPLISSGSYVHEGGAICMELLTKQGWSSVYTVEALVLQVGATLIDGNARVRHGRADNVEGKYSFERAYEVMNNRIIPNHDQVGWPKHSNS